MPDKQIQARHSTSTDNGKLSQPFCVRDGSKFKLSRINHGDTPGASREEAGEALARRVARIAELQEMLYAQDRWAVLLIFQALDAAGKDSAIKHVFSGVNPQGVHVTSFKAPSAEEIDHDYLWRTARALPERGRIGVFNRSYYEEVLVVRVHPEILQRQHLPPALVTKAIWQQRFEDIAAFERYLSRNGVLVRKFFLNVSKQEQRERFLARLEEPEKNWKFNIGDVREREFFDDYMDAYQDAIRHTATEESPWYVVPADKKWFARLVIADAVIDALESLRLAFPKVDPARSAELQAARKELMGNK
jgi:PPK2 family polyphosphate:nucleotide phosphotransferase